MAFLRQTARLNDKGELIIPAEVCAAASIQSCDLVAFDLIDDAISVKVVDEDQWNYWKFWSKDWQDGEAENERDKAAGKGDVFLTHEDFLAALKEASKRNQP